MTNFSEILGVTGLIGVFHLLALSLVLLSHRVTRRIKLARNLALFFLAGGLSLLFVILANAGLVRNADWLEILEIGFGLFAPVQMILYLARSLNRPLPGLWLYLPLALFCMLVLVLGPSAGEHIRMAQIMWVQMAFTGYGGFIYFRWLQAAHRQNSREWGFHHSVFVLAAMVFIHATQILRFAFFEQAWTEQVVPAASAVAVAGLIVYGIFRSRILIRFAAPVAPLPTSEQRKHDQKALARVESVLTERRLFRDPGLTLRGLATAADLREKELSRLLRPVPGGFYSFINGFRVREAERLLKSPEEAKTSAEAIGLLSGFRTRSGFYKAFREETGLSPAEYRKRFNPKADGD